MDSIHDDFMSKVMKRRLGGGNSSCESSPEKRIHIKSVENGLRVLPQSERSLSDVNNLNQGLTFTSSVELEPADEIDGFTEDGIDNIKYCKEVPKRSTEPNKVSDIAKTSDYARQEIEVQDFKFLGSDAVKTGCTSISKEKLVSDANIVLENVESRNHKIQENENFDTIDDEDIDNHNGKFEYVLSGEETSVSAEPRIEMFNESDSNSSNNPFILTSFQSLNAKSKKTSDESIDNEADEDARIKNEINDKSSVENSQEFGWKVANQDYDLDSEEVNDKDSTESVDRKESDEGRKKSETLRSDHVIIDNEDVPELKNESHAVYNLKSVLHHERSDSKFRSENTDHSENITLAYKNAKDNFTDIRSETYDKELGKGQQRKDEDGINEILEEGDKFSAKITETKRENLEINDSETTNQSKDERKLKVDNISDIKDVRKEKVESCTTKKSRKQYVPKRVRKFEVTEDNANFCGFEMEGYGGNKDVSEYGLKKTDSTLQETTDLIIAEGNDEPLKDDAAEHKKSEKSRKQCKPKRIDQLQNINDQPSALSNETEEIGTPESYTDISDDADEKFTHLVRKEQKDLKEWDVTINDLEGKDSMHTLEDSRDIYKKSEVSVSSCSQTSDDLTETDKANSEAALQSITNESSGNHFGSLNTSPFFYGLSPNLDLISSLSPGLFQRASSTAGSFALNESGQENLEVIRQLREIRCNRYRKISMAEKREIAGYASSHGVSHAAAYYNVSKSAVSMWTKLDFDKVDEESTKQRKNCMIGNEKFEALCKKVRNERESKFKGMTKQDKFEVSRYAKLVGVREMARCLDVALGTVSGWMRQFPYKVETESSDTQLSDESNSKSSNLNNEDDDMNENKKLKEQTANSQKRKKSDSNSKSCRKKRKSKADETEAPKDLYKTIQKDNTMYILPVTETEQSDIELLKDEGNATNTEGTTEAALAAESENDLDESLQQKDELDKMIAETWQPPDFDKCFEDIKDMIKDSPLEGDDFFRSLFERVISCRAFKYKTLKPSEKLEVVRYAKRIGVRKVAKILGLATGTLSGWNTKYQSSLGITDPNIDMSNKSDLLVSYLSPDKNLENVDSSSNDQKLPMTPGANLDNSEKSEVTAVKLLFKDKFPVLLNKIGIAKQVKFRNITTEEKIEFVKCSKLVGIRPTARVFNIPIGTLSGWITKYTKTLHPAYHVDADQETSSNSQEASSQFSPLGIYNPNIVGRTAAPVPMFQGLMNVNPAWHPVPGFAPGGQGPGLNMYPQFPNISSSSPSMSSSSLPVSSPTSSFSSELYSSPLFISQSVSENIEHSRETANGKEIETGENIPKLTSHSDSLNVYQSKNLNEKWNPSETLNQSRSSVVIKTKPIEAGPQSDDADDFEKEAKLMAQRYLTATYERMGIPIV